MTLGYQRLDSAGSEKLYGEFFMIRDWSFFYRKRLQAMSTSSETDHEFLNPRAPLRVTNSQSELRKRQSLTQADLIDLPSPPKTKRISPPKATVVWTFYFLRLFLRLSKIVLLFNYIFVVLVFIITSKYSKIYIFSIIDYNRFSRNQPW